MRYQIITLRIPFEPRAVHGPPEDPPYEWDFMSLLGTSEPVVILDCDPVSEDPDVQPIEPLLTTDEHLDRCANGCVCTRVEKVAAGELDVWGEDPDHSRSAWQYEVANGDTNQGYWDWCDLQDQDDDNPANQDDGERRCRHCGESYNVEDHGGEPDNGYCITVTCQVVAGVDPTLLS